MSNQQKPFAAYVGPEPYFFVCYAHRDDQVVYSDIAELHKNNINIWYDEGIPAGTSWRGEIAAAIKGAEKLLFFISKSSLDSAHCLREVDFALSHDTEILPIYLDDLVLPDELELALNRVHALFRYRDPAYMEHLQKALYENPGLKSISVNNRSGRSPYLIPGLTSLLVAAAIGIGVYHSLPDDPPVLNNPILESDSTPSGYSFYLDGLKLMARWDKGDNINHAISRYREAISLDPEFALAYARLSDALRIKYVLSRDEAYLSEATVLADTALQLNPNLPPVQIAQGRLHMTQGNFDLATASIEKALAIDPNDVMANEAIGVLYERLGRIEEAEKALRKAISLEPENLIARDSYANFLFAQSRFDEAAENWQRMISLAPDHFTGLVNLGSALSETGRTAEAITMYEKAIAINPTYMAYSNLGTANARAQRYDAAVDAYKQAITMDESDWLAWGNLAFVYVRRDGMTEQTRQAFQQAIEIAEDARKENARDPFLHSDLALYYYSLDENILALERIETALALAPNTAEIQAAAAEVMINTGNRDRAIVHLTNALEMGFPRQRLLRNKEVSALLEEPGFASEL